MAFPATLQGNAQESSKFKLNGITTTCKQNNLSAEIAEPAQPGQRIDAAPSYSECTYADSTPQPMTVQANGCKYQFSAGAETSPGVFAGTMAIGPAGCAIKLFGTGCTQTVPTQSAHATVTFENLLTSPQSVEIRAAVDVEYTSSGIACGTKTGSNGRLEGRWVVSAATSSGTPTNLFAEAHDGLWAGDTVAPRLTAEILPAAISGQQSSVHKFSSVNGITAECSTGSFSGSISSATSQFDLAPSYSGCTLIIFGTGLAASANLNSCTYRNTLTGTSPTSGNVALVCPAGKALEFVASVCTLKISPQTLAASTYASSVGKSGRSVLVSASGTKLSYSTSGYACGSTSAANMTYSGGTLLQ